MTYIASIVSDLEDARVGDTVVIHSGSSPSTLSSGPVSQTSLGELHAAGYSLDNPAIQIVSIVRLINSVDLPTNPGVYKIENLRPDDGSLEEGIYLCTKTGTTPRFYYIYTSGVVDKVSTIFEGHPIVSVTTIFDFEEYTS